MVLHLSYQWTRSAAFLSEHILFDCQKRLLKKTCDLICSMTVQTFVPAEMTKHEVDALRQERIGSSAPSAAKLYLYKRKSNFYSEEKRSRN